MKSNTFESPEFAYPQTVEKNAQKVYDSAISSHHYVKALQAAIQLDVASTLQSQERYKESVERFADMQKSFPAPYSNLAALLEAQLYTDIYSAQSWKYNNRVLPADSVPESPLEWDKEIFRNKVTALINMALKGAASAVKMPLGNVKDLVADYSQKMYGAMTVADFIDLRASTLLQIFKGEDDNVIPFNSDAKQAEEIPMYVQLVNDAIGRHSVDKDKYLLSELYLIKSYMLDNDDRQDFLLNCFEELKSTPYAAGILSQYCTLLPQDLNDLKEDNKARQKKLELLSQYASSQPDAVNISQVMSAIEMLESKEIKLKFNNFASPGEPLVVSADGENIFSFYILVYKLPYSGVETYYTYQQLNSAAQLVTSVPVNAKGKTPDRFHSVLNVPGLTPGMYALVPSSSPDAGGIFVQNEKRSVSTVLVSDISYFTLCHGNGESDIYVVSAANMEPVPDAKVKIIPTGNRKNEPTQTLTTDRDGKVKVKYESCTFIISKDGSFAGNSIYNYNRINEDNKAIRAHVLTDLSIFKPGDEVEFSAILYSQKENELHSVDSYKFKTVFRDANYQTVDSLDLCTDCYGRASGKFIIPKSGLLGSYSICVNDISGNLGSTSINVAEYKAPTFYVDVKAAKENSSDASVIRFIGEAKTYSGMPVAGAKVNYTVQNSPLWWWRSPYQGATYGSSTMTDGNGKFEIALNTAGLKGTPFEKSRYSLKVTVTDNTGESQEAPTEMFALGSGYSINPNLPEYLCVDKGSNSFSVPVINLLGEPVKRQVNYSILLNDDTVQSGTFESPTFTPDLKNLKSGKYDVRFELPDQDPLQSVVAMDSVVIFRYTDKVPPVETPLWLPENEMTVAPDADEVAINLGSSYPDSYIFAAVSDDKHTISTQWVKVSGGIVTLKVAAPKGNDRYFVKLLAIHEMSVKTSTVQLIPAPQLETVRIETESFRSNSEPGAQEHWKFKFSVNGKPLNDIAAMAVMSNKALDAIAPFRWNFNPAGSRYWSASISTKYYNIYSVENSVYIPSDHKLGGIVLFESPLWNTYGYSLYPCNTYGVYYSVSPTANMRRSRAASIDGAVVMEQKAMLAAAPAEDAEEESMAISEDIATTGSADSGENGADSSDSEMGAIRNLDCPLAFFMPSLTTNSNGVVDLGFTMPQFVGTWKLQVMGYTPDMKGSTLTLESVVSKRVMASLNAPRFLRTGDKAQISATLFNNSDATIQLAGRIELINAVTGEILKSQEFKGEDMAASASRVVTLDYDVPADVSDITVRAYALTSGASDGEQTVISVFPSSTPVVESDPFYLAPGESEYTFEIPRYAKDASATLKYCDNPVWECVTALPDLVSPQSANALSQIYALYGNAIASGLFNKYPALLTGIQKMAEISGENYPINSNLEKNEDLKTVTLNNTPWVNSAQAETARMQALVKYADKDACESHINDIIASLKSLQNGDGGWSWCSEMESSSYITARVLLVFSQLKSMGYLPAEAEKIAKPAFKYAEKCFVEDWNRSKQKVLPVRTLLNYLYVKSSFKGLGSAKGFSALETRALSEVRKDWTSYGIYDKSVAAILFERRGEGSLSRAILESVRQYASVSDEKGMWFDNLGSSYMGWNPLITTAQALEAYAEIEPQNPAVDKLRQWLIMNKQVQNWGDYRNTAEVINAILTAGSDWTAASNPSEFYLNGNKLAPESSAPFTGAFTINLAATAGGNIKVVKNSAGPAWGGVISQYVSPITDVRQQSIPELSIRKEIFPISSNADGMSASAGDIKVGDKVRITLTIVCDRDLDYVAVTDERSACLEPVDQLSAYTATDGVFYYKEVRNNATNFFIPWLSKGTHVIHYECYVDRAGEYSLGLATAQSQYEPLITAHSQGTSLGIRN